MSDDFRKLLVWGVGGLVGVMVCLLLADALLLSPAEDLDQKIIDLAKEKRELEQEEQLAAAARAHMLRVRRATFSDEELSAREAARQRLQMQLQRSGLTTREYSIDAWAGRSVSKVYEEVGWSVRATGTLEQVTDFLYLLREDPYVHRVDNLVITPQWTRGEVDLKLRYSTLVLHASDVRKVEPNQVKPEQRQVALDTKHRDRFDVIASRDLLRPYIKKRVVQQTPSRPADTPRADATPPAPPTPAGPTFAQRMKLVGLPQWGDQSEAIFKDTVSRETTRFERGERVGDAAIAMIDYRVMQRHDDAERQTPSRLILKVGPDYWAVELGDTLAQRHRLSRDMLPQALRSDGSKEKATDAGPLSRTGGPDEDMQ